MKLPLKLKAILMIVLISILVSATGVIMYGIGIRKLVISEYKSRSIDIAQALAEIVNAEDVKTLRDAVLNIYYNEENVVLSDKWGTEEFDEYISHYSEIENLEAFKSLREELRKVQDVIEVDCLYINWLDVENDLYLYLVDAAYEDACPPGCADSLYLSGEMTKEELVEGCLPNITHTKEYGYLMTTGMPIRLNDEIVGYASLDLSMNEIISYERRIFLTSLLVFGIATIVVSLIGIFAVDRTITRPINKLSAAALAYSPDKPNFKDLNIHTGDEIEALASSMKRMDNDIKDYYNNLMATKNDLETVKEHAEEYKREANIDYLTGLKNKRAYDLEIEELDKDNSQYAIVMIDLNDLKNINDKYGHENGDITIKKLANLINKEFNDSSIFRIGGDEFVVIVKSDYISSLENMINNFRKEIEKSSKDFSLNPWEKLSAACGYAKFDHKLDKNVQSVFNRADENMYIEKEKMKTH